MPKIKLFTIFFLLVFSFLINPQKVSAAPDCTNGQENTTKMCDANFPRDCDDSEVAACNRTGVGTAVKPLCFFQTAGSLTGGCYQQNSTTPPIGGSSGGTTTLTPSTTPITFNPSPVKQGENVTINFNYVKGFGNLIVSTGPTGITSDTAIFSVDTGGCKTISGFGGTSRYKSITCQVDTTNNAWAGQLVYHTTYNTGSYEVTLAGQSGTVTGLFIKEAFCVNSCPAGSLKVTINPTGPFDNTVANNFTLSWDGKPGNTFEIIVTGNLFKPSTGNCTSTGCSKNFFIPANQPPGVKTISVIQDGNTSIFGTVDFELKGIATAIAPVVGSGVDCSKEPGKCSTAAGQACNINTKEIIKIENITAKKEDMPNTRTNPISKCSDGTDLREVDKRADDPNGCNPEASCYKVVSVGAGFAYFCYREQKTTAAETTYRDKNGNPVNIDSKDLGVSTAIGCIPTEPSALVGELLKFAAGGAGGIALLLMIFGAFRMVTSAGNEESLKAGKEQFTSAIIGLLFIIFAVLLLQIIGVDILGLPGFTR